MSRLLQKVTTLEQKVEDDLHQHLYSVRDDMSDVMSMRSGASKTSRKSSRSGAIRSGALKSRLVTSKLASALKKTGSRQV